MRIKYLAHEDWRTSKLIQPNHPKERIEQKHVPGILFVGINPRVLQGIFVKPASFT